MPGSRRLGSDDEDRVADWLAERGLTVVTRRYRGGGGELDIVAFDGEVLVCVEVKRRSHVQDGAEEAVSAKKLARMARAANHYLHATGLGERPVRYDVVAIGANGVPRHHVDVTNA